MEVAGIWDGLRARALDLVGHRIRLSLFQGSEQEKDFRYPPNCRGWGRIRTFQSEPVGDWAPNPLPALPAAKALGCSPAETRVTQLFQLAVCNLRCWYCFVDRALLVGDPARSALVAPGQIVEQSLQLDPPPKVLVLSGGNPGLAPEWVLWVMRALTQVGAADRVYLWSDDNLTASLQAEVLTPPECSEIAGYRNYGAVGCFKGFDEESFSFNTGASTSAYRQQFAAFRALRRVVPDLYAYVTFTVADLGDLGSRVRRFMDDLERLDAHLPLRVVPLEVRPYHPTQQHLDERRQSALNVNQYEVLRVWRAELAHRYPPEMVTAPITAIPWASETTP